MYDPTTGRWVTRDPIGTAGGLNLYEYCGGDPVNGVDAGGLKEYSPTYGPNSVVTPQSLNVPPPTLKTVLDLEVSKGLYSFTDDKNDPRNEAYKSLE